MSHTSHTRLILPSLVSAVLSWRKISVSTTPGIKGGRLSEGRWGTSGSESLCINFYTAQSLNTWSPQALLPCRTGIYLKLKSYKWSRIHRASLSIFPPFFNTSLASIDAQLLAAGLTSSDWGFLMQLLLSTVLKQGRHSWPDSHRRKEQNYYTEISCSWKKEKKAMCFMSVL